MYCVIQEITKKKPNQFGAAKELKVTSFSFRDNYGREKTKYGYTYSTERFERPIKKAYKISIHESYRKDGKVKKRQWSVCTMSYYDFLDYSLYDCIHQSTLNEKLTDMGITEEEFYDLVYEKIDPLIYKIEKEFRKTEEYKTKSKHEEIISLYNVNKTKFNKEHTNSLFGESKADEYDYCYDVFGVLRNPSYLKTLESMKKMRESAQQRSYQDSSSSNYDYSSYFKTSSSNYTDDEKVMLKKIYKVASKKFHPDVSGDDGSIMKLLTKLKEEWGI
ncbi:hypothetical protein EVU96_24760 [Bacillus infantis]|uniref:hypothetical protein n=1 Tax=Bacillus infantis TaxID=324767 RepID=UPI00101DFA62|nr:hypothetical protein [Bacillus infantis]RYI25180.1 hypothetical protein EVU96_24760 [Bacillus infantis]